MLFLIRIPLIFNGVLPYIIHVQIIEDIKLEIFTIFLRTPVPVRSPFQGLAAIVADVKRHPHALFTLVTKIVLFHLQSIEEEPILPVRHLPVEFKHQVFQRVAHLSEPHRRFKVHGMFQMFTQSLTDSTRVDGRFNQPPDFLFHPKRQGLGTQ